MHSYVVSMGLSLRSTVAPTGCAYHILWRSVGEKLSLLPTRTVEKEKIDYVEKSELRRAAVCGLVRHCHKSILVLADTDGLYFVLKPGLS
jgi:hypothetical protein